MESREYANLALEVVDEYYPDFLADTDLPDTLIVKVMFYGTMIVTVAGSPLEDPIAQDMLILDLNDRYREVRATLAKTILSKFN